VSLSTKIAGLAACLNFDNPLQLTLARLAFRQSRFVPHRLNGLQFIADQQGGDECGLRPCLVEGMYEPFLQTAGIFHSRSALNVVDLGANAGGFSLIFPSRKIPLQKITAVEMNPLTYSRMRLNLLTNLGPRAVPINAAIGGCSMNLTLPFTFGGTGDSIPRTPCPTDSSFSVPMLTLDELLDTHHAGQKIDLLKMDIEGAEWDILDSEKCTRLADCQHLLIEVHPRAGRQLVDFQKAVQPYGLTPVEIRNASARDVFLFSQKPNA
jgi:FkbM family methyltransferase